MKKTRLLLATLIGFITLLSSTTSLARGPAWSFSTTDPTTIDVPENGSATITYTVTNNLSKPRNLVLLPTQGLSQKSKCNLAGKGSTCTLMLSIAGSYLPSTGIHGGPSLCQSNSDGTVNENECYQPALKSAQLNITKGVSSFYSVGGTIHGLIGSLTLSNGADVLTKTTDGAFTFSNTLASGSGYLVLVQANPATQICTVINHTGTINNSNVTNVEVSCSTNTRTIGGTVSGLTSGDALTLQNNLGTNLSLLNTDGDYTFSTPEAQGALYNVTVLTQPSTKTCSVSNGSGTVGTTDITDVNVTCSDAANNLGGSVSGLMGTLKIKNGAEELNVTQVVASY